MSKTIKGMGAELVSHSEAGQTSRQGLADELFPFIWTASKKMSTRAISAWFKENHSVQVSQSTVSRVLREKEDRMRKLFLCIREMERAFYGMIDCLPVCTAESPTALFDPNTFEQRALARNNAVSALVANSNAPGGHARMIELYNTIREEWFILPEVFREECKKYSDESVLENPLAGAEGSHEDKKEK